MPRKPAWFAYAVEVKAKLEKMSRNKMSRARRDGALTNSLFVARTRFGYPGFLGDWESVLNNVDDNQRNGKQTHRRKP